MFAYNQTVNNFGSVTIANVYSKTVIVNTNATRASFNGGTGGTTAQPTPQEQAAAHEQHVAVTPAQTQQQKMASTDRICSPPKTTVSPRLRQPPSRASLPARASSRRRK